MNGMWIHLRKTTPQQFALVCDEMLRLDEQISDEWNEAQGAADCTDQIDPDLDNRYAAMRNFLLDMGFLK